MSGSENTLPEGQAPPRALPRDHSGSFTDQSYLTYLVPAETDINLDEAFKGLEQGKTVLESIPQRETLFFGTVLTPSTHALNKLLTCIS